MNFFLINKLALSNGLRDRQISRPWIFLPGFVKDNVYASPLPMTLEEVKKRVTEACKKIDHDIFKKVWQETEY
jgi:hypothetical protein